MALVGALLITVNAVTGFTNRSLRAQVNGVLGVDYTQAQMTYGLRRLRLQGPDPAATALQHLRPDPDGIRIAISYTKVHDRLLRPLLAANAPPAPLALRHALRIIDRHVDDYISHARIAA